VIGSPTMSDAASTFDPRASAPALTKEQRDIAHAILAGIGKGKPVQVMGGWAGTGKTTVARYLLDRLYNWHPCAFTGKAANVLRRKGLSQATTIHGLMYIPHEDADGHLSFERRDSLPCAGVLVDEASMVPSDVYEDLRSYHVPLIFVGDHGQLEPVNSDFNLMQAPEYRLETIHRNAGPIAEFANAIRQGSDLPMLRTLADASNGMVRIVPRYALDLSHLTEANQVICAYNRTRVDLNERIRSSHNRRGPVLPRDRIICLRNNRDEGLFNGMQGEVRRVRVEKKQYFLDFLSEDGIEYRRVEFIPEQFGKEKNEFTFGLDTGNPFDFAYAITCHKSQGSEYDKVLVMVEKSRLWSNERWAYTAPSRARRQLTWVVWNGHNPRPAKRRPPAPQRRGVRQRRAAGSRRYAGCQHPGDDQTRRAAESAGRDPATA
jgi:exodeoxyribonuclease-5